MAITVLYRGAVRSCNFRCWYCPFTKTDDSDEDLAQDQVALLRFIEWIGQHADRQFLVQFTPWGEALIHPHYRDALISLSHQDPIIRVAVQTNLSVPLDWLARANASRLGLWCTYHPAHLSLDFFLEQCAVLGALGVRFSVGLVGLREHLDHAERLRAALPKSVYVWINAWKREPDYYLEGDLARIQAIDPLFSFNLANHPSQGRECSTGLTALTVDADGIIRRCHFVKEPLGTLASALDPLLQARPCPRATCDCHIGMVYLKHLGLDAFFGEGVVDRVPDPLIDYSVMPIPPLAGEGPQFLAPLSCLRCRT